MKTGNYLVGKTGEQREQEKQNKTVWGWVECSMKITGIWEISSVWVGGEAMEEKGLERDDKAGCTEDFKPFFWTSGL